MQEYHFSLFTPMEGEVVKWNDNLKEKKSVHLTEYEMGQYQCYVDEQLRRMLQSENNFA